MRRRSLFAALCASVLIAFAASGCATFHPMPDEVSPFEDWRSLETEHFALTYPARIESTARASAAYFERAHSLLSKSLHWSPSVRVQVLLLENTDEANGMTLPIGRFGMVLMLTPPEPWYSTTFYDDWLWLLIVHEYTHFLNMDPTRGVWEGLRYVFGDTLLPNSIWAPWMLEGLAVYMETRFTRSGRGRSPYYEMVLRAAVEEGVLDDPAFITLDRVNGENPYFPGGETRYLFGYQLMNQVARKDESHLGQLSFESSYRVPFLINGNLEIVSGKDWYQAWDEFVAETRERSGKALERVRAEPVTTFERLTERGYAAYGPMPSPDGNWLAYTQTSLDENSGVYLRNLRTGDVRRLADKRAGVGMSFSRDSRFLFLSSIRRINQYNLWSDLAVYDLNGGDWIWLTESKRARDPDLSPSGDMLVFGIGRNATTGIAVAKISPDDDGIPALGEIREIFFPAPFDRASNPKFSPDGKRVVFTLKRNGKIGADLVEVDLETGSLRELLSDGNLNRFPAFGPAGDLFFVSDANGIDNLYRYSAEGSHARVSNMTTGIWFPAFSGGQLFASVFSTGGWDVAKVDLPAASLASSERMPAAPAPSPHEESAPPSATFEGEASDYSAWPSLIPRQWAPSLTLSPYYVLLGGQVSGYDVLGLHSYLLAAGFNTGVQKPDFLVSYGNRMLGPTFRFTGSYQTSEARNLFHVRDARLSADVSFPFRWTESELVPSASVNFEREYIYFGQEGFEQSLASQPVPSFDVGAIYSDAEQSKLAISKEEGRRSRVAARAYSIHGEGLYKALVSDTEYFRITAHSVLVPMIHASWNTRASPDFRSANVVVQGRASSIFDTGGGYSLDRLNIRGYADRTFHARAALLPVLEYRFPIWRVYRGWGTYPVYLEVIDGTVFAESAYFPGGQPETRFLPSAGGGARVRTRIFYHVPLIFSLNYHHGFATAQGGTGEIFFGLNTTVVGF